MDPEVVQRTVQAEAQIRSLLERLEALEKGIVADQIKKERDDALKRVKELEAENAKLRTHGGTGETKETKGFQIPDHTFASTSSHKFSKRVSIKELYSSQQSFLDTTVTVAGWVKTVREQGGGRFCFIEVNDGSCFASLQVILDKDKPGFSEINGPSCGIGASVYFVGKLVKSPGQKQPIELQADIGELLGECVPGKYPLATAATSLEHLRNIAHLRPRTNTIGAMSRVRNACALATHLFFQKNGFYYVHTPIITASDCEGAGEMFQVTSLLKNGTAPVKDVPLTPDGKFDYSKDFFSKPAFLTVSGQLNGEMYASALAKIYTFGPTFRAEVSHTTRHVAEFWMIEPEIAFYDLNDNMDLAEAYVKFVTRFVLANHRDDLEFFDKHVEKGLIKRLENVIAAPFQRLTYTQAIEILLKSGHKFVNHVEWGIDLASEHERFIAEQIYKKPVILTDYPKDIKAFYMKLNSDGKTVRAMDVLVPRIGELIGGSQREESLELLEKRIAELKLDREAYNAYLDLRRFGSVPHSGFGLGFERLIMFVTGLENIRDVIPFPRTPGHAEF